MSIVVSPIFPSDLPVCSPPDMVFAQAIGSVAITSNTVNDSDSIC